jgi:hypothetical protein
MAVVDQGFEFRRLAGADFYPRLQGLRTFLPDELIDQQVGAEGALDAVVGAAVLLPGFQAFAVGIPEIGWQFHAAGVEEVGILQHLVVEIVLCVEAQRAGLDAHVDILGDEDHRALRLLFVQMQRHGDDLVVGARRRQGGRQHAVDRVGLEEQAPARQVVGRAGQVDAMPNRFFAAADDLVEHATGLTRVARHFRHALLVGVEFLEGHHRHVDVVLLEAVEACRIVHQHIGVEYEQFGRFGRLGGASGVHGTPIGLALQGLQGSQYLGCMAVGLDAAPLSSESSVAVDEEGAAFDTLDLFAVHILQLDDIEQAASSFIGIAEQFERQAQPGFEALVRLDAVARYAPDAAAGLEKLGMQIAELLRLGRAAGCAVLGVEVDHQRLAALRGEAEGSAPGGGQRKIRNFQANCRRSG